VLAVLLLTQIPTVQPVARVEHPPITEMSGIVASRRYPGIFWVHNDSGDLPRIFAIRADGSIVHPGSRYLSQAPTGHARPVPIFPGVAIEPAANRDWEDIATDGKNLYIADVGNNGNARRDLAVYVVPEPNPESATTARVATRIPIAYPDQAEFPPRAAKPFDCEALFWRRGKLYFVTKHRTATGGADVSASLYRLDTRHLDVPNLLTKVDTAKDLGGWVTAADVSPDGRYLAVLTQAPSQAIWVFDANAKGDRMLSAPIKRFEFRGGVQCEAIAFDGNDRLIFTNEQRSIFRVNLADFRPATEERR